MPVCARPRWLPADRQTALNASVVKLVDTMDSKSIAFTGVAVRVRPLVPLNQTNTSKKFLQQKEKIRTSVYNSLLPAGVS